MGRATRQRSATAAATFSLFAIASGHALAANAVAVSAGGEHTCAVTDTGAALCWGHNDNGQLGNGTTTDRLVPSRVLGLGSNVAAIAAGVDHTCALLKTGGVKCWGNNDYGQLGNGTRKNSTTRVDVQGLDSDVGCVTM